jgi:hypothetical protein
MLSETGWTNPLMTFVAVLVGLAIPSAAVWLKIGPVKKFRDGRSIAPTDEKLLRPPGHSLQLRLEDQYYHCLMSYVAACAFWTLAVLLLSLVWKITPASLLHPSVAGVLGLFLVLVCSGTWAILRVTRGLNEAENIRLGLRGEQAVGEVLNELGNAGFRAFHDLPAGKDWNVDHVAVGPPGVFVLETKTRRKPRRSRRSNRAAYRVTVDGNVLRFPDWDDRDSFQQAAANARWVANYLSQKTGEKVRAEAIVVLPGWYVEYTGRAPAVKAMNPKYLAGYLRDQPPTLSPAQQRRIAAALEDLCRTLEF